MPDVEAIIRGIEQIIALLFVNLVPILLNPQFLTIAISIDCLILGISAQALISKKTEQRLDEYSRQLMNLVNTAINLVSSIAPKNPQPRQEVRVVR